MATKFDRYHNSNKPSTQSVGGIIRLNFTSGYVTHTIRMKLGMIVLVQAITLPIYQHSK